MYKDKNEKDSESYYNDTMHCANNQWFACNIPHYQAETPASKDSLQLDKQTTVPQTITVFMQLRACKTL